MKKRIFLAIAMLALTACDNKPAPAADPRPRALVSNPPTAWLVKQVLGDKVIVQTLAGTGGCGHEFQPTDKEIVEAGKAQVWFTVGLEFEKAEWAQVIKKKPVCEGLHGWMSLPLLGQMAHKIAYYFADPMGDADLEISLQPIEILFYQKHAALTALLLPLKSQAFLADHPAYTYFAADYNLHQISIEADGHEPSDADLNRVIAQAKAAKVKVLFLHSEEHRAEAEAVAKAVGAQVILADPNTENTPELLEMMANALVKAHSK